MKRYIPRFILISLFLALFMLKASPGSQSTLAQDSTDSDNTLVDTSNCKTLQIVFVIDQSGSMFGFTNDEGNYVPASDPDGLRFEGPKAFFDLIANARWQNYADAEIAIAAIDFGDDPHTVMPWVPLDADSEASYEQLLTDTSSYFTPRAARGNTLPLRGLQSASSLFAQMETPQDGCPRRAVIILTDGLPTDGMSNFNRTTYFSEMAQYITDFMPASAHKVYVIGLDRNNSYFDDFLSQWEAVAGNPDRVKKASSPQEMSGLMTQIAVDLLLSLDQTGGGQLFSCVDGGEPFMVPPYIQEMSFQFTKPDDTYHLNVLDPSGQDAQSLPNAKLAGYDQPIEKLTITAPEPGFWEMTTQVPDEFKGSCLLSWIAFKAVDEVVSPEPGLRVPQFTAVDVEFQIVKTDGAALPDYQDDTYDLSMDVVITAPDGEQVLTLGADPGQVYRGQKVVLYPGTNEIEVTAVSFNPDNSQFLLFNDEPDGTKAISSIEVEPVSLSIVTSPPVAHEQYQSFPFAVTLATPTQGSVEIDLPVRVKISWQKEGGDPIPIAVTEVDGNYEADVQIDEAGSFKLIYEAEVETAEGTFILGPEEIEFSVSKITRLGAQFTSPNEMVATTIWGTWRPGIGIDTAVQLTDDNGQPVSPSEVIDGDPTQIFDLIAENLTAKKGEDNDVSDQLSLVQGERAGLFRSRTNQLGIGEYEICVEPTGQLKQGYAWQGYPWCQTVQGTLNPTFWTVLTALIVVAALLLLLILWFLNSLRHPLNGRLVIYTMVTDADGSSRQNQLWADTLPRWFNRKTFRRIKLKDGTVIPWLKAFAQNKTMSKNGQAKVKVKMKGKPIKSQTLTKGGTPLSLGEGRHLVKDPTPHSYHSKGEMDLRSTLD